MDLTVWVSDDAKYTSSSGARPTKAPSPVTVKWIAYRSPGIVKFTNDRPQVVKVELTPPALATGTESTIIVFAALVVHP